MRAMRWQVCIQRAHCFAVLALCPYLRWPWTSDRASCLGALHAMAALMRLPLRPSRAAINPRPHTPSAACTVLSALCFALQLFRTEGLSRSFGGKDMLPLLAVSMLTTAAASGAGAAAIHWNDFAQVGAAAWGAAVGGQMRAWLQARLQWAHRIAYVLCFLHARSTSNRMCCRRARPHPRPLPNLACSPPTLPPIEHPQYAAQLGALFEGASVNGEGAPVWQLAYTAWCSTDLALLVEVLALQSVTSTEAAMVYSVEPISGAALAYVVLGERWGPTGGAGSSGGGECAYWGGGMARVLHACVECQYARRLCIPCIPLGPCFVFSHPMHHRSCCALRLAGRGRHPGSQHGHTAQWRHEWRCSRE